MQRSKEITFIGFSVKARKIIYGINLISLSRKTIFLLIMCFSAAENTKKEAINLARKKGVKLLVTKDILLEEIVNKTNCKLVALTDKNLAAAVLDNADGNLVAYNGGADL